MKLRIITIASVAALATLACAFVFLPQNLTVVRGRVISGNLSSLFNSDNNRLVVRNGVRVTNYDNPVDIQAEVICGQSNPTTMTLRIESSASTLGLVEYVEMYNWTTNQFDQVYRGPITRDEVATQVPVANCGQYTLPSGQMKVRYWVDARGPVTANSWTVSLDELTWDVNF